jgi:hypothetical protein
VKRYESVVPGRCHHAEWFRRCKRDAVASVNNGFRLCAEHFAKYCEYIAALGGEVMEKT